MTPLAAVLVVVALGAGFGAALALERWRRRRALQSRERVRRIAFPFTGEGLSEPALAAALRLARAEGATLLPVYLAIVPMRLAVEVPLPTECTVALPLLEAIEQRAAHAQVPVDSRIERGRTLRHALRELIAHERFERMVVAAGAGGSSEGFDPEDVAWLLAHVPGELIALRPASKGGRPPVQIPVPAAPARPVQTHVHTAPAQPRDA
ncbi:MAG TPA: hypothetical protein VNY52_01225 [Solirubrobacteraceae bacterium]|jgi:hypothetical protein|nr:hypothetical protein [Solirubrobacteraceae bacterium]